MKPTLLSTLLRNTVRLEMVGQAGREGKVTLQHPGEAGQ